MCYCPEIGRSRTETVLARARRRNSSASSGCNSMRRRAMIASPNGRQIIIIAPWGLQSYFRNITLAYRPTTSLRDRHPAVDRQDLPGDLTGLVAREIEDRRRDVGGLDQTEQMRVGKPGQRGVARDQLFDPLSHRRRWCDRVDANSLRRIGDS